MYVATELSCGDGAERRKGVTTATSAIYFDPESLRDFIRKAGLSVTAAAEQAGIDRTHLSALLNGHRKPSDRTAESLATVVNVRARTFYRHACCGLQESGNDAEKPKAERAQDAREGEPCSRKTA